MHITLTPMRLEIYSPDGVVLVGRVRIIKEA